MINAPFTPEMAAQAPGPLLEVRSSPDGRPIAVRAGTRLQLDIVYDPTGAAHPPTH